MKLTGLADLLSPFGGGAGAAPPPQGAVDDFWTRLVALVRADPGLTAAFPGGVVNDRAGSRQAYPFLRVGQAEPQKPRSADDWPVRVTLYAYASADQDADGQAKRALDRLVAWLDDTANRAPVAYGPWVESGHWTEGTLELVELMPGPGGVPTWRASVGMTFWVVAPAPLTVSA